MRRGLILVGFALLLAACGATQGTGGGALSGTLASRGVTDWSFAAQYPTLRIETRPDAPSSAPTDFVVVGSRLYIDVGQPDDAAVWRRQIREDPRARIQLGDYVYPVRMVALGEPAEIAAVEKAWTARFGAPPAGATFVRLASRPAR